MSECVPLETDFFTPFLLDEGFESENEPEQPEYQEFWDSFDEFVYEENNCCTSAPQKEQNDADAREENKPDKNSQQEHLVESESTEESEKNEGRERQQMTPKRKRSVDEQLQSPLTRRQLLGWPNMVGRKVQRRKTNWS